MNGRRARVVGAHMMMSWLSCSTVVVALGLVVIQDHLRAAAKHAGESVMQQRPHTRRPQGPCVFQSCTEREGDELAPRLGDHGVEALGRLIHQAAQDTSSRSHLLEGHLQSKAKQSKGQAGRATDRQSRAEQST